MTPDEAISKLRALSASISEMRNPFSTEYAVWERKTNITLDKIYGKNSTESKEFRNLEFSGSQAVKLHGNKGGQVVIGHSDFSEAGKMLDSFIAEIEEFGLPEISKHTSLSQMNPTNSAAIEKLNRLREGSPGDEPFGPEFKRWSHNVETALIKIFGFHSREHQDYMLTPKATVAKGTPGSEARIAQAYQECISSLNALLSSSIDQIEEYGLEEDSAGVLTAEKPIVVTSPESNKVFLIHGHDGEVKQEVARFLEKIGVEPIILHEQANEGQTIIEKFEKNSDVGFAVALLTPDDVGGVDSESIQPRARQNVILELGFFMGKIGRKRTLAIVKGGVEKPSDYDGVVYTPYDTDQWKLDLVREMKAAGLEVDANKAF